MLRGVAAQGFGTRLTDIRFDADANRMLYPALSVPLGPEDALSCPPEHVEFLERHLASLDELHLLVIGYSGLDTEVLRVLREANRPIGSLMVVQASEAAWEKTREAVVTLGEPREERYKMAEGFQRWCHSGLFDDYFTLLRSR
jgi:hypothetical protein